ncbi:MAG: stage II sporulation protein M [Candidatus Nanohalobium sp.]
MLPELIYREEQSDNIALLFVMGIVYSLMGYGLARAVFPSQVSMLSVVFAAVPLMYPLTRTFLEDEKNGRPHSDEVMMYGAIFAGEVLGFFLLVLTLPAHDLSQFYLQIRQFSKVLNDMGIITLGGVDLSVITGNNATGAATGGLQILGILLNNLFVFFLIFAVSVLVSSAGAFILVWNASVIGVFLGVLTKKLSGMNVLAGTESIPSPIAYVPHATFEMTGFIIAGISGSLVSAAIYREHFDRETWIDYAKLVGLGVMCVFVGAIIEGL